MHRHADAPGQLASLYRGDQCHHPRRPAGGEDRGALGSNITVQTTEGARINAQVVGLFRSGMRAIDESTAYVLVKTAQILAQQTGARERDPRARRRPDGGARAWRGASSARPATSRWPGRRRTRTCSSAFVVRNVIMYTVVGAILLVASFGTYNIISTITHEKTRDIAILKSLGLREATVRRIFVLEALAIGADRRAAGWALGYALTCALGIGRDQEPDDRRDAPAARLLVPALCHRRRPSRWPPRSSPATSRRARRRAPHPVDIIRGAT